VSPKVAIATLRKIVEHFPDSAAHHQLNPTYEDTDPSAIEENTKIFKELQKFEGAGLVVPVDEEHMYFAAMNSRSCRLTAIGAQYWRLVNEGKL